MAFRRFFILNIKISFVVGILGLFFYILFSPIEKRNSFNYKYSIYNVNFGKPIRAMYVKRKSNVAKLDRQKRKYVLRTGNDVFFLSINNKAWILDTIEKDIVKFRAKKLAPDSSEVFVRGYTLIENVHSQ